MWSDRGSAAVMTGSGREREGHVGHRCGKDPMRPRFCIGINKIRYFL